MRSTFRAHAALAGAAAAVAVPATADGATPIQRENRRAGTPVQRVLGSRSPEVEGYTSEISYLPGQRVTLHVSAPEGSRYRVSVYRLGWYRGRGARLVGCVPNCMGSASGHRYPTPPPGPLTGEIRAEWPVTGSFRLPADAVSGYYVARLEVLAPRRLASIVPFIVRPPARRPTRILVQVPVNTWQAYNSWGGKSLYPFVSAAAVKVSFDRPYDWHLPGGQALADWELPFVRFVEREGYDVSYQTDVDTDRAPRSLLRHRLVVALGHGEYWTSRMRTAFDTARELSTNLAFLGANIGYWQVRYENDGRTLVAYKSKEYDPEPDPALKTWLFRDLTPPRAECMLLGIQHQGGPLTWPRADYEVERASLKDPWFAGTGFTATSKVVGVVSVEHDEIPTGNTAAWSCNNNLTVLFQHQGPEFGESAQAVRYVHPSGARVFSAGSLEFVWGLDGYRVGAEGRKTPVDTRLQRFMRNALADLQRPAHPLAVDATARGARVTVRVDRARDPRVGFVLVARKATTRKFAVGGKGVRLVCRTLRATCSDTPGRPGVYRYGAVVVDRWGHSSAFYSAPVRVKAQGR